LIEAITAFVSGRAGHVRAGNCLAIGGANQILVLDEHVGDAAHLAGPAARDFDFEHHDVAVAAIKVGDQHLDARLVGDLLPVRTDAEFFGHATVNLLLVGLCLLRLGRVQLLGAQHAHESDAGGEFDAQPHGLGDHVRQFVTSLAKTRRASCPPRKK
jgi:hypothetical protein